MKNIEKFVPYGTHIEIKDKRVAFYITNAERSNGVELIAATLPNDKATFSKAEIKQRLAMSDEDFVKFAEAVNFEAKKIQERLNSKTLEINVGQRLEEEDLPVFDDENERIVDPGEDNQEEEKDE